ncbi:MAG: hypothetical protein JXR19_09605 [Bacteroidia bacterium]
MRYNKNIALIIWLLAALLAIAVYVDSKSNKDLYSAEGITLDISEFVDVLEKESEQLFTAGTELRFNTEQAAEAYRIKKKSWYVINKDSAGIAFWNSNKIGLDSQLFQKNIGSHFYRFGDDFYLVINELNSYMAFRIANDQKLSDRLVSYYPELNHHKLGDRNGAAKISEVEALHFVYAEQENSYTWLLFILLNLVLLALFFLYLKGDKIVWAVVVTVIMLVLDVWMQNWLDGHSVRWHQLFEPQLYASSNILSSLGALVDHILVAIPIVFLFSRLIDRIKNPIWMQFVSYTLLFFASDLVLDLIKSLVLDSNISFNFEDLYGISPYTFIAISAIGLSLFALWAFMLCTRIQDNWRNVKSVVALLLAAVAFVVFQYIDASRSILSLLYPVAAIGIGLLLYLVWKTNRMKMISLYFLSILLASGVILRAELKREKQYIKLHASKLVASQDLRAEYILRSFEDQLAQEFLVPEDYENFNLRKDVVENRIKRLYFSNYLEKYELRLISFDSLGNNINSTTLYSFQDLDKVYNENTKRTISNYFYQINNPTLISGYIAKYENCDINGHYGTTFILLQPRLIQSDFIYPEAFANQKKKELINIEDYSYGIYFNQKLISQKGNYSYSLTDAPAIPSESFGQQWGEYYHFHFTDQGSFHVVLSKKYNVLTNWLSTFTFSFIFMLPIGLILLLLAYVYEPKESLLLDLQGKFLSTRIQVSLTLLLLVGLLLSVYIIINYIRVNYNDNLENQLLKTVKNIGAQFQNQVDLEQKLESEEDRLLLLNEESSGFKVDLNLYSAQGELLSTTKPYLINEEILAPWMNPKAYEKMKGSNYAQLLQQEELEGTDYLSAYVPLFNGKNKVIAYLNIPYFAKNEQLNKQISTILVNVINIYFLLLLAGILVALFISKRISKPLLLIRERFAETGFGAKNELITYHRDDEIGQLVGQYNKMVVELEESARKLAETEREGAWREMAKQVAHEIKNPLTPMKLSIQHLQRAYSQGGAKVDELFEKTSKLLIEQIDSLSKMASEFSSFAKMPEDNYERFDLSEALQGTVDLFTQTKNVKIESSIAKDVFVFADPEQIKRVFNNLIKNGIQSIPEGKEGRVQVRLDKIGELAVAKVKDNGKGISEELGKKIFEPNFSTKTSGMGLGLAISKKIIETAKGKITFKTVLNRGTEFEIIIPLKDED